jgi:hypothetical protein
VLASAAGCRAAEATNAALSPAFAAFTACGRGRHPASSLTLQGTREGEPTSQSTSVTRHLRVTQHLAVPAPRDALARHVIAHLCADAQSSVRKVLAGARWSRVTRWVLDLRQIG